MSDISINSGNIESVVNELINRIQTEIIDAGTTSGNMINNVIENSSGDFITALKDDITSEVLLISSIGELLIDVATFIQSAANAFTYVDQVYNTSIT